MFRVTRRAAAAATCLSAALWASGLHAAEGFQVRFNMAGTLGPEMSGPERAAGWWGGLTWTEARIRKVTGEDGEPLRLDVAAGSVPLPAPLPPATYPASQAVVDGTGRLQQANLRLAWLGRADSRGRPAFALNLPYIHRKSQNSRLTAPAPALSFSPGVPPGVRTAASAQWATRYQQGLDAAGAAETAEVAGWGDLELQAAWIHNSERARLVASLTWVAPTGAYDPSAGPDVSLGNFHTVRPALEGSWAVLPQMRLGARVTLGLNTRNRDNDVRSGHWAGLESAATWQTGVGLLGVQALHVQQLRDDAGGALGANRYRSTAAGAFFTTALPAAGVSVTLQHTAMLRSRNARHGQFTQIRLSRAF